MTAEPRASRIAPVLLATGFITFLMVIGYVIVSAMGPPADALWFEPSPISPQPPAQTVVTGQLTVEAREADVWVFVDLDRQSVVTPPNTAGWDLAIRRFNIVSSGGAIDLGEMAFDSLDRAPETGYSATVFGADTINAALDHWYRYGFTTHLLQPNGHLFVIRTADGRYAKLEMLSYYCPEVTAGCTTFRYVYQPSGSPDLVDP